MLRSLLKLIYFLFYTIILPYVICVLGTDVYPLDNSISSLIGNPPGQAGR